MKRLATLPIIKPLLLLLSDHHFTMLLIGAIAAYAVSFAPTLSPYMTLILVLLTISVLTVLYFISKAAGAPINVIAELQQDLADLQSITVSKADLQAAIKAAFADLLGASSAAPSFIVSAGQQIVSPPPARTTPKSDPVYAPAAPDRG